jgi:hypothetical protein
MFKGICGRATVNGNAGFEVRAPSSGLRFGGIDNIQVGLSAHRFRCITNGELQIGIKFEHEEFRRN